MDYMKEVYYDQYCDSCKHKDVPEAEDPCHDCLNEPARQYSHKPAKYEEDK